MARHDLPAAPDAPVVEDDHLAWELFWHRNRVKILGALAAVVAAGVVLGAWWITQSLSNEAAAKLLATANDIPALEAVVAKFPGTMPAADAMMRLAAAYREAGRMDDSTAMFRKFVQVFPSHPLAGGALLGVGQNLDASGKADEAIAVFTEVTTKYPGSYAAPFAAYSTAGIYVRQMKRNEARTALEQILGTYPQSNVAGLAQMQLQRLDLAPAN